MNCPMCSGNLLQDVHETGCLLTGAKVIEVSGYIEVPPKPGPIAAEYRGEPSPGAYVTNPVRPNIDDVRANKARELQGEERRLFAAEMEKAGGLGSNTTHTSDAQIAAEELYLYKTEYDLNLQQKRADAVKLVADPIRNMLTHQLKKAHEQIRQLTKQRDEFHAIAQHNLNAYNSLVASRRSLMDEIFGDFLDRTKRG